MIQIARILFDVMIKYNALLPVFVFYYCKTNTALRRERIRTVVDDFFAMRDKEKQAMQKEEANWHELEGEEYKYKKIAQQRMKEHNKSNKRKNT